MKYPSILFNYFFSILLFVSFSLNAQDNLTKTDSTSITKESIGIGDISEESEKLGQQLLKLKSALGQSQRILEIDSLVTIKTPEILKLVDSKRFLLLIKKQDQVYYWLKVVLSQWVELSKT